MLHSGYPSSIDLLIALALVLALIPTCAGAQDGGIMESLLLGDIAGWPNHLGDDEPAVDVTLVPCRAFGQDLSDEYLQRWSRIYFPRNLRQLLGYEVLFLARPRLSFFTILQQEMMVDFMGTEDRVSIAYPLSHYKEVQEPWMNSPISDAVPIDFDRFVIAVQEGLGQWGSRGAGYTKLELVPGMPPVFSPFGETEAFSNAIYEQFRPAYARDGARIWIKAVEGPPMEPEVPAFVSWGYGDTEAWGFGIQPGIARRHWQEAGEWWEMMFLNICYHTRGEETLTFDEALRMMAVKSSFSDYGNSVAMFHNIVDFVFRVGANTEDAESVLTEGDALHGEAMGDYLDRDYEAAEEKMDRALTVAANAMKEATEAKNRALSWIYLSEWMATTSVVMISGVVLWWLMVKRGLYREISTTELRRA